MGLDAGVYCDCVETGRLTKPHPFPELATVEADGSPDIASGDAAQQEVFLDWYFSQPCAHQGFWLVNFYLGNIALVGYLRSAVDDLASQHQTAFPVLREQVIYSGTHAGDYLLLADVERLAAETAQLRALSWECLQVRATLKERLGQTFYNQRVRYLTDFLAQMDELIEAARRLNKPIAF